MMEISAPCVVSLTWQLMDAQNRAIDELKEPVEFFVGGDDLLAKVEEMLAGYEPGDTVQLQLEPEHAFGDYDAGLVCFEARSLFPEQLETGMAFEGLPAGHATADMPAAAIYVVTDIYPEHVVLDGNHPLAGMALRMEIQVRAVRPASDAEVEAGSVGGAAVQIVGAGPARRSDGDGLLH